MTWNIEDVPNLSGKTILVTGASSGIGFHAAKTFAHKHAKVILASKSIQEVSQAANDIRIDAPHANLVEMEVDLSELNSVKAFVAELQDNPEISRIDVLLLNAGIASGEYIKTSDGIELTFATNHLGHWLLTGLLMPYMSDVPDSRIICVSSLYHHKVKKINYDLVTGNCNEPYKSVNMYAQTKFANQLFVQHLNKKLKNAGSKTIAVAAHPGIASTNLYDPIKPKWVRYVVKKFIRTVFLNAEGGSHSLLMAATDADFSADKYYGPSGFIEGRGRPSGRGKQNPAVFDEELQEELWSMSEKLCNFSYNM